MKALRLALCWLVLWAYAPSAWAQMYFTPPPPQQRTISAGSTTTFDPANIGTGVALSGGNLTATVTANSELMARTIANHTTGLYYVEVTAVSGIGGATNALGVGPCTSSANLNSFGGSDTHSVALYDSGTQFFNGGSGGGPGVSFSNSAVLGIAENLTSSLWWVTTNGVTWNGSFTTAQVVAGTGGSSLGSFAGNALYLCVTMDNKNSSNAVWTLNAGGSTYAYIPPTGFGNM